MRRRMLFDQSLVGENDIDTGDPWLHKRTGPLEQSLQNSRQYLSQSPPTWVTEENEECMLSAFSATHALLEEV